MTSPLQIPGVQPQVPAPPIRKTPVGHCGYTSLMGTPAPWQCPGCGTVIQPPES